MTLLDTNDTDKLINSSNHFSFKVLRTCDLWLWVFVIPYLTRVMKHFFLMITHLNLLEKRIKLQHNLCLQPCFFFWVFTLEAVIGLVAMQICHPQPHLSLRNVCLHHGGATAGAEGPRKTPERFVPSAPKSSSSGSLRCSSVPGRWKLASKRYELTLTGVGRWGAGGQRSRLGNSEGGILLAH